MIARTSVVIISAMPSFLLTPLLWAVPAASESARTAPTQVEFSASCPMIAATPSANNDTAGNFRRAAGLLRTNKTCYQRRNGCQRPALAMTGTSTFFLAGVPPKEGGQCANGETAVIQRQRGSVRGGEFIKRQKCARPASARVASC